MSPREINIINEKKKKDFNSPLSRGDFNLNYFFYRGRKARKALIIILMCHGKIFSAHADTESPGRSQWDAVLFSQRNGIHDPVVYIQSSVCTEARNAN